MMLKSLALNAERHSEFYETSKQSLRTRVIDFNIKQHQVAELNRVYRHDPSRAKVASPALVCVLVVYSILQVVRQQIFQLYWSHEVKIDLRIPPKVGGDEQGSQTSTVITCRQLAGGPLTSDCTKAWNRNVGSEGSRCSQ